MKKNAIPFIAALGLGAFAFLNSQRGNTMKKADPGIHVPNAIDNRGRSTFPRGIRNNNPGNIEVGQYWNGEVGSDGRYAIFKDAQHGIRAMLLEIWDSIERDRDNTIRRLINQWAPPTENLTGAYVAHVSQVTGIAADQQLIYATHAIPIAKAITIHENGVNPYPAMAFEEAYRMAGK